MSGFVFDHPSVQRISRVVKYVEGQRPDLTPRPSKYPIPGGSKAATDTLLFYFIPPPGETTLITGRYGPAQIESACTIKSVTLFVEDPCDIVVDIHSCSYANFPTAGASICASAKPTIIGGQKYSDDTLTGWTTSIAAGASLIFYIDSIAQASTGTGSYTGSETGAGDAALAMLSLELQRR